MRLGMAGYLGQPAEYGPFRVQPSKRNFPFAPFALSPEVLEGKAEADLLGETYYLPVGGRRASSAALMPCPTTRA